MKYILHFALLLALPLMLALPANAAPGDRIILDGSGGGSSKSKRQSSTDSNAFVDFLQKSFYLRGGGFWSGGIDDTGLQQGFGFGRLAFDYSFNVLGLRQRVYASGGYAYRQIDLGLTYKEGREVSGGNLIRAGSSDTDSCGFTDDGFEDLQRRRGDVDDDPMSILLADNGRNAPLRECTFKLSVEDKGWELREAFVSLELFPDVVLNVGRQRPTWGQFDVFSVVNSILPIEIQSQDFGVANSNLRRPQDMAQLKVFLFERLEVSAYGFYQTTLDPLLEKSLKQMGGRCEAAMDFNGDGEAFCNEPARRASLSDGTDLINQDKITYAGRILWRGDYFTAGATYNRGYYALFSTFAGLPIIVEGTDGVNDFDVNGDALPDGDPRRHRRSIAVLSRSILPQATSYAGELAIPISNWTIKAEVVYTQTYADIGLTSDTIFHSSNTDRTARDAENVTNRVNQKTALFDFIKEKNGGKGYVSTDTLLAQAGFNADYDEWQFGLNVLFFLRFLSDEADRANNLYKAAYPDNESNLESSSFEGIPFPTAFVFYNFGADQQHRVGLVGGFLGIVAGANVFYTGPLYVGVNALDERINWTASADYTTSLASQLLSDSEDNALAGGNEVELSKDFAFSFRVGATLEF